MAIKTTIQLKTVEISFIPAGKVRRKKETLTVRAEHVKSPRIVSKGEGEWQSRGVFIPGLVLTDAEKAACWDAGSTSIMIVDRVLPGVSETVCYIPDEREMAQLASPSCDAQFDAKTGQMSWSAR